MAFLKIFAAMKFLLCYNIMKNDFRYYVFNVKNSGSDISTVDLVDNDKIHIESKTDKPEDVDDYIIVDSNNQHEETNKSSNHILHKPLTPSFDYPLSRNVDKINIDIALMILDEIINNRDDYILEEYKEAKNIVSTYKNIKDVISKELLQEKAEICKAEMLSTENEEMKKDIFSNFKDKIYKTFYFENMAYAVKEVVLSESMLQLINGIGSFTQKLENIMLFFKKYITVFDNSEMKEIMVELLEDEKHLKNVIEIAIDDRSILYLPLEMYNQSNDKDHPINKNLYTDELMTFKFLTLFVNFENNLDKLYTIIKKEGLISTSKKSYKEFMYDRGMHKINDMIEFMNIFYDSHCSSLGGPCLMVQRIEYMILKTIRYPHRYKNLDIESDFSTEYLRYFFTFRADLSVLYHDIFRSKSNTMAAYLRSINNFIPILQKILVSSCLILKIKPGINDLYESALKSKSYHLVDSVSGINSFFQSSMYFQYSENIKILSQTIEDFLSFSESKSR